jgi:hypothetical protein
MAPSHLDNTRLSRLLNDMVGVQFRTGNAPLRERVLDSLADMMFSADEVLQLVANDMSGQLGICEQPVRRAYDSINNLMKSLGD